MHGDSVPDKEERKKTRRQRVSKALVAQEPGRKAGAQEAHVNEVSESEQQVADSLAHLDKNKSAGIDSVTAVRVAADDRETQRRVAEEAARLERMRRLQEESVLSSRANAAVEMRWGELLEQGMPRELHAEVEAQRDACAAIVASKDALIAEFQAQLRAKDEEYVKALKAQAVDVTELLRRMRAEFASLRQAYALELEAIEAAFLRERSAQLSANKAEVDALFDKRREGELAYMEARARRQAQYQAEVEELLTRDGEEYIKLKVKLETDIQTLEQQLEEMRATYQLNTEKLEYNYRVLTERDMENSATLAHQKRKLTKLKDALSALAARHAETEARDRRRNEELTEEYRRVTRHYRDLQAKFRHFEASDNARYDAVWSLHQQEALALVDRVLKADEVIQRQQLGWDWRPPQMDLLLAPDAPTTVAAAAAAAAAASASPSRSSRDGSSAESAPAAAGAPGGATAAAGRAISGARVRAVLALLAAEANFLVDAGPLRDALASITATGGAAAAVRADAAEAALRALGVRGEGDLAALMAYFFPSSGGAGGGGGGVDDDSVEEPDEPPPDADFAALGLDPEAEPEALKLLITIIQPDDVIAAISAFVADQREARAMEAQRRIAAAAAAAGARARARERAVRRREQEYWQRVASVLGGGGEFAWRALEAALARYNGVLAERAARIAALGALRGENAQLRALLRGYLGGAVNEDLIVPPADTMPALAGRGAQAF
ncbi:sperm tail-domain-containing protein [Tribonema minus]|uniref:Sperm tail-domain-containing protein n=1 Tax=Tribonema minus TaxID=303371 RepID=A0A835Z4S9_9STRA|nr:sperm tail-domain-containing protein [Tribonema minus]